MHRAGKYTDRTILSQARSRLARHAASIMPSFPLPSALARLKVSAYFAGVFNAVMAALCACEEKVQQVLKKISSLPCMHAIRHAARPAPAYLRALVTELAILLFIRPYGVLVELPQNLRLQARALRQSGLRAYCESRYSLPGFFAACARAKRKNLAAGAHIRLCSFLLLLIVCRFFAESAPVFPAFTSERIVAKAISAETLDARILPMGQQTVFPLTLAAFPSDTFLPVRESSGPIFRASALSETRDELHAALTAAELQTAASQGGLVRFDKGKVLIRTVDGDIAMTSIGRSETAARHHAVNALNADMFSPAKSGNAVPLLYGEETDEKGLPWRWSPKGTDERQAQLLLCNDERAGERNEARRFFNRLTASSRRAAPAFRGSRYKDFIRTYADKYDLASSLLLAIMHTESGFNQFAVSPSRAVGLMQIVPEAAGHEVHRFLMGSHGIPSMETLFNPEINIKYGAAYLHLLDRYHFGGIKNRLSRQLCTIAAYNGGPNAVLRLFHPDKNTAQARINAMTPEQLYASLTTEMPRAETRRYVALVLGRMKSYSQ